MMYYNPIQIETVVQIIIMILLILVVVESTSDAHLLTFLGRIMTSFTAA